MQYVSDVVGSRTRLYESHGLCLDLPQIANKAARTLNFRGRRPIPRQKSPAMSQSLFLSVRREMVQSVLDARQQAVGGDAKAPSDRRSYLQLRCVRDGYRN